MTWEVVIGLETHAQLSTASKIFSGASTAFGAAPNTQASAVDIALPGVLPSLNKGAVERAIRFGLAVNGTINRRSVFAHQSNRIGGIAHRWRSSTLQTFTRTRQSHAEYATTARQASATPATGAHSSHG